MHVDRNDPGDASTGAGDPASELDVLRTRCWRQANEIDSLADTISLLRRGATKLAIDNTELRAVIACLEATVDVPRGHGRGRSRSDPSARCR
jgi:hypothetical protein